MHVYLCAHVAASKANSPVIYDDKSNNINEGLYLTVVKYYRFEQWRKNIYVVNSRIISILDNPR